MEERPRFLADEMLGSLARWLRIIGYDTVYVKDMKDSEILELASSEGRFLLTRDQQLAERAGPRGLLITSAVLDEQLEQVAATYGLRMDEPMSRCTLCNGPLRAVTREEIGPQVPERVRASHEEFYICQNCGQVYWKGSHWERINERLRRVLTADNSPR
jgi:uncharacterized protein with PIN domain